MREPRYPLPGVVRNFGRDERGAPPPGRGRRARSRLRVPWRVRRREDPGSVVPPSRRGPGGPPTGGGRAQTPEGRASGGEGRGSRRRPARVPPPLRESGGSTVRGCAAAAGRDNDPSAGSPTETLLRLLLPLNDKVQWTSRDVAGGGPPASPRSEHFTGPFNR